MMIRVKSAANILEMMWKDISRWCLVALFGIASRPSSAFMQLAPGASHGLRYACLNSRRNGDLCCLRMAQVKWETAKDPASGKEYWYNPATLETRWEAPVDSANNVQVESKSVMDAPAHAKEATPFSPQAATATFEMMKRFTAKLEEYRKCKDSAQKQKLRIEVLEIYTDFAVPALSLAIGTFISFPGAFAIFFLGLQITGRGLPDIQAALSGFPPAVDALSHVDPSLGNVAISALLVELVSPILIFVSVAIKGKIESRLQEQLPAWGLDAEGLSRRIEALAGGDDDVF